VAGRGDPVVCRKPRRFGQLTFVIRDGESGNVEFLLRAAGINAAMPPRVIVQASYPREQMFDLEPPR
jgi:hypothetical protein